MCRFIFAWANTDPQMSQILLLKRLIHCTDFFFTAPFLSLHWFFSLHRFFFIAPIVLLQQICFHCTNFSTALIFSLHQFFLPLSCTGQGGELAGMVFPSAKNAECQILNSAIRPPAHLWKDHFLSPNSKYERAAWCWKRIKIIVGWPIGCPKKTKSPNFVSPRNPLVFIG